MAPRASRGRASLAAEIAQITTATITRMKKRDQSHKKWLAQYDFLDAPLTHSNLFTFRTLSCTIGATDPAGMSTKLASKMRDQKSVPESS